MPCLATCRILFCSQNNISRSFTFVSYLVGANSFIQHAGTKEGGVRCIILTRLFRVWSPILLHLFVNNDSRHTSKRRCHSSQRAADRLIFPTPLSDLVFRSWTHSPPTSWCCAAIPFATHVHHVDHYKDMGWHERGLPIRGCRDLLLSSGIMLKENRHGCRPNS